MCQILPFLNLYQKYHSPREYRVAPRATRAIPTG